MREEPQILYYFELLPGKKKVKRHFLGKDCCAHRVSPEFSNDYWRCQGKDHDIYAHGTLKEARDVETSQTKIRIQEDIEWLRELTKNKNWRLINEGI